MKFSTAASLLGGLVFLIAGLQCSSAQKAAPPEAAWINNMHRLSTTYLQLMPLTGDPRGFSNAIDRDVIERDLRQMVEGASEAALDPKAPNADPVIAFTASRFSIEMREALSAFKVGDQQWTKFSVSRAANYCISCHTREDRGAKDFSLPWQPDLVALNGPQRVQFYLANRQYSSAQHEAEKLASDTQAARKDPRTWLVTLEKTLAMLIRVQKDPNATLVLAERMSENNSAPNYMRRAAIEWIRECQNWKAQTKHLVGDKEKFQAATRLLASARTDSEGNPRMALVDNLRASGVLHELLENPKGAQYAESLYYSGLAEQALRAINVFGLEQSYFEGCIKNKPHSQLAERCYASLENSVSEDSPVFDLDPDIQSAQGAHLAELQALAEVVDDPQLNKKGEPQ